MDTKSVADGIESNAHFTPLDGKGAKGKEWQTGKYARPRREIKGNAGLLLEHAGLTDLDLDSDEARAVVGKFVPTNTLAIGRGGRISHLVYGGAMGNRTIKHGPGKDATTLEVRHKGKQVMWAGSVHPETGETIEVLQDVPPLAAPDERRILLAATAALIARSLPDGGRHNVALALAGFLLRRGLDEEEVKEVFAAAWTHRHPEGVQDALNAVDSTAENLEGATGGTKLEELVPGLVGLLCAAWGWTKERKTAAADNLVNVALGMADELFTDQYGQPYALVSGRSVPVDNMADSLRVSYFREHGKSASHDAVKNALSTVAALARTEGSSRELHTRWARVGGNVYYQTAPGTVWRVGPTGWVKDDKPPVRFRNVPLLNDLPDPIQGGTLEDLCEYAKLDGRNLRMYVAWLASVPYHDIPRPILGMIGGKGTGKTTRSLLAKKLLDEDATDFVKPDADILRKATHRGIVGLDNQTGLDRGVPDLLCGLVTGTGNSSRELYTNNGEIGFKVKAPVILNGIDLASNQPDLLDRTLIIETPPIDPASRFTEREFWDGFERDRGKLLGVVFDLISGSLRHHRALDSKPRMADWAEIASAVYEYAGWGRGRFVTDWAATEQEQNSNAVEGSIVGSTILEFVASKKAFSGPVGELLDNLQTFDPDLKSNKYFPGTPNKLSREINKIGDALAAAGVIVSRTTTGKGKAARKGIQLRSADTGGGSADGLPIDSQVSADQESREDTQNAGDNVPRSADTVDTLTTSKVGRKEAGEEGDERKRKEKPEKPSAVPAVSTDPAIHAGFEERLSADLSADPANLSADPHDWGVHETLSHLYSVDAGFYSSLPDTKLWAHLVECGLIPSGTPISDVADARARILERVV